MVDIRFTKQEKEAHYDSIARLLRAITWGEELNETEKYEISRYLKMMETVIICAEEK